MEHVSVGEMELFIRLDRGEEVIGTLTELCREKSISAGRVSAIGAICNVELGYYDLGSFKYLKKFFYGNLELVSMLGNVALDDGQPIIHAHAALSDGDLALRGGHLFQATVAATVEVHLTSFDTRFERVFDPETHLKLMKF